MVSFIVYIEVLKTLNKRQEAGLEQLKACYF